jgi:hypothetical protein
MKISVNISNLSDTNDLKFIPVPSMYEGFTDVIYKSKRIAIINGLSAPLQWTAENGANIPTSIIDRIERLVKRNLIK